MDPQQPEPLPPPTPEPVPIARPLAFARPATRTRPPSPLLMMELTRLQAALDAMLLLLVPIGITYIPQILAWFFAPRPDEPLEIDPVVLNLKWFEAGFAVLLALYFCHRGGVRAASMGLGEAKLVPTIGWGVAGLGGAYLFILASTIVMLPFLLGPENSQTMRDRIQFTKAFSSIELSDFAFLLIAIVVHEELLFRGLLLPQLRRATGSWTWAVILSSAVFGVLHFVQGPAAMVQIFGVSIVFSVIFIVSRSLYAVMIAHYLFNFCQVAFMHLLTREGDELLERVATALAQLMNIASP